MSDLVIRGRGLSPDDVEVIRQIAERPGQSRRAISVEVCARLGWYQPNGRLWDMACRYLLLRLQDKGLLKLPAARGRSAKRHPLTLSQDAEAQCPITAPVRELGALRWERVDGTALARLWKEYIYRYHYLGLGTLVGPHVRYLIGFEGGWLAAMGFSGAAWKLRPRDTWIDWSPAERQARLHLVVNQTRYLILPWVHSKNLASHLLGVAARLLVQDWQEKYRYRPLLLETFVDARRFAGTCYRAANWIHLGHSQGRGKMDRHRRQALPVKDIYVYPLHRRACEMLRAT
ncbi:MAG: Druantia anti-phage system protein DruA [Thermodesulfobacteriota bacterium]